MLSVVGESFTGDAANRFLSPGTGAQTVRTSATLVREPSNPHDRNAVKVMISGVHVGYLKRELARRYAPALDRDIATVTCDAKIVRRPSKRARGKTVNVSVWLPPPGRI